MSSPESGSKSARKTFVSYSIHSNAMSTVSGAFNVVVDDDVKIGKCFSAIITWEKEIANCPGYMIALYHISSDLPD